MHWHLFNVCLCISWLPRLQHMQLAPTLREPQTTPTSQTAPYRGTEYSSTKEYAQPGPTGNLDRTHSVCLESEIPWPSSKQDSS